MELLHENVQLKWLFMENCSFKSVFIIAKFCFKSDTIRQLFSYLYARVLFFSKTFLIVSQLLVQYHLDCALKCRVKWEFYSHKKSHVIVCFHLHPKWFRWTALPIELQQVLSSQSQMHEFQWQFQFQWVVERRRKLAWRFLSIIKCRLCIVVIIAVAFVVVAVVVVVSDTTTIIVDNKSIALRVKELTIRRNN